MHFAIFGKKFEAAMVTPLQLLIDHLHDRGASMSFHVPFFEECSSGLRLPDNTRLFSGSAGLIEEKPDFLISLGGDGSMLQTITLIRDSGIPVLGINTGRMGFLSNTPAENVKQAIDHLLAGKYQPDSRTLLHLESGLGIFGDTPFALNEFSIYGSSSRTLILVQVWIDGDFLNAYWADGLIIATPTGSTAYSLSCHGPIVSPGSGTFIINPIASHNVSVTPIVIPDTCTIKVRVSGRETSFTASLDSRSETVPVESEMVLTRESFRVNFVRLPGEYFFNTIRQKLLWGRDVRN